MKPVALHQSLSMEFYPQDGLVHGPLVPILADARQRRKAPDSRP